MKYKLKLEKREGSHITSSVGGYLSPMSTTDDIGEGGGGGVSPMMMSSYNSNFWHKIGMKKKRYKKFKFVLTLQFWLDISPLASHYTCNIFKLHTIHLFCFYMLLDKCSVSLAYDQVMMMSTLVGWEGRLMTDEDKRWAGAKISKILMTLYVNVPKCF